jgi:hypothetical protein
MEPTSVGKAVITFWINKRAALDAFAVSNLGQVSYRAVGGIARETTASGARLKGGRLLK